MKTKKKLIALLLAGAMCLSFAGCTTTTSDGEDTGEEAGEVAIDNTTRELKQNDYRGGVQRTGALQDHILAVMEGMKANNTVIRNDSPNSFWTADGYQDFVSTFLDIAIINDTQWFNEEETTWEDVVIQLSSVQNSFTTLSSEAYTLRNGIEIARNEKDDYSITGVKTTFNGTEATLSGATSYRILFDCDKDWCKAAATTTFTNALLPVTSQLFEYQRVDNNTFAIQTSRERLVVVLVPAEADVDIRERTVSEFYYSKLVFDGNRTTFEEYEPLPEKTSGGVILNENIRHNALMAGYPQMNGKGDLSNQYGERDSMFYTSVKEDLTGWVFEDHSLQQAIVYKDGALVVTTYNKLSTNYERFIYALTDSKADIPALEGIVEVDNLVGVNSTSVGNEAEKDEKPANTAAETTAPTTDEDGTDASSETSVPEDGADSTPETTNTVGNTSTETTTEAITTTTAG